MFNRKPTAQVTQTAGDLARNAKRALLLLLLGCLLLWKAAPGGPHSAGTTIDQRAMTARVMVNAEYLQANLWQMHTAAIDGFLSTSDKTREGAWINYDCLHAEAAADLVRLAGTANTDTEQKLLSGIASDLTGYDRIIQQAHTAGDTRGAPYLQAADNTLRTKLLPSVSALQKNYLDKGQAEASMWRGSYIQVLVLAALLGYLLMIQWNLYRAANPRLRLPLVAASVIIAVSLVSTAALTVSLSQKVESSGQTYQNLLQRSNELAVAAESTSDLHYHTLMDNASKRPSEAASVVVASDLASGQLELITTATTCSRYLGWLEPQLIWVPLLIAILAIAGLVPVVSRYSYPSRLA